MNKGENMNKKEKFQCIHFIYNSVYADYLKALRKMKTDGMYDIRKKMYEKYLKQFQEVINKEIKMDIGFKPLKNEKDKIKCR